MNEFIANAETAYASRQYAESLTWFEKALEKDPNDLYALSRAGAICVSLSRFEDALKYFGRAKDLDPQNGDNLFNFGNACFFNHDYAGALAEYAEAERVGCSEDVTPRLYYQMAMLCSLRQDIRSAQVYFRKCESADKSGMISLNPDLISEKLKLYMASQDYENAAKTAAQLVAIQPTEFRNYMVCFSIRMAERNYAAAEKTLADAEAYADLTEENRFDLDIQKAAVWVSVGEEDAAQKKASFEKAADLLRARLQGDVTDDQRNQLRMMLSDIYLKDEQYDRAIASLQAVLNPEAVPQETAEAAAKDLGELTPEEIEEMLREDMERIQEKIDTGEIDADMGAYARVEYDEGGNERHVYDDDVFAAPASAPESAEAPDNSAAETKELSAELREKVHFSLLTAFLGKEDFESAAKFAELLKHSNNKYYHDYGVYTSALCGRKRGLPAEQVEREYAEAIAYFRNQTFADPRNTLAAIFRARLYAEQGKTEKAKEIANLLADADRESVLQYLEACRA